MYSPQTLTVEIGPWLKLCLEQCEWRNDGEIIYDVCAIAIDGFEIVPHKAVCHFAVEHACTSNAKKGKRKEYVYSCVCVLVRDVNSY